jgi:hypothetical protein
MGSPTLQTLQYPNLAAALGLLSTWLSKPSSELCSLTPTATGAH